MTITEQDIRRILYGTEGVTEGSWTALRSIPQEGYDGWYLKVQPNAFMRGFTKEIGWINGGDENLSLASHIARCDPNTIRNLCELALDGLRMREFLADEDNATDEIEEAISESFDIDWTARAGARSVFGFFKILMKAGDA